MVRDTHIAEHDTISLSFEENGSGPPVLLIHGWGGDRSIFAAQSAALASRHRVVVPDLRGHGASSRPPGGYDMATFAADVIALCNELELSRPLIVGHSMGGAVALEVAARAPWEPAALVLLDSSAPPASTSWSGVEALVTALSSEDYAQPLRDFCRRAFFVQRDDIARREAIIDGMVRTPRQVLAATLEGILAWSAEPAARACTVPLLYVAAEHPRGDLVRLQSWVADLRIVRTSGTGHFVQVFAAEQVNRLLGRFINDITC